MGLMAVANFNLQGGNVQLQGSNYNPQPATKKPIQGGNVSVQKTAPAIVLNNPKAKIVVPSAAQIAAAAQRAKIILAQEVARQKAAKTAAVQKQLNLKVATNKAATKILINNSAWKGNITLATNFKTPNIVLPKQTEYDKEYAKAYAQALADFNNQTKAGKKNFFQSAWDKISFGQDRRESAARAYATKRASEIADKSVAAYEQKLNAFIKEQAKKKAAIEAKKFSSQTDFDNAVTQYTKWENVNINNLEHDRATITAQLDAYGNSAKAPLSSGVAHAAGWVNKNVVHGAPGNVLGSIWKYTLGSGTKNVPSVVTTPARLYNWVGNLNTKNRQIYKTGGGSFNRANSNLNAWQSTFGQRNANIKPVVVPKYSTAKAEQQFGAQVRQLQKAGGYSGLSHSQALKKMWDAYYNQSKFQNSAKEFLADPLNLFLGAGTVSKAGWLDKASTLGRASKSTSWLFRGADKLSQAKKTVASTKLVKWLGSDAKTPEQQLIDTIDVARKNQRAIQDSLLPRINALNKKLSGNAKQDISVFDKLANLSDSEAKVLQRMVGGRLTARDRLLLAGKNYAPVRAKLEDIAQSWTKFTEDMKIADSIKTTRFGAGKRLYSPATAWLPQKSNRLADYNFRLFKKHLKPQSQSDFYQGAIDRYFKSALDSKFVTSESSKAARRALERDRLLAQYDKTIGESRASVEAAYKKTRSPLSRFRKVAGTPTRLWKKSVLKFRPAWTVNNVIYNTQAAALAGGGRALVEQGKLLNPRYWRKVMDSVPADVKTNLAKEIGSKGRLDRFYSNVENWSRVAAYKAAKSKGLSDEQALRRVNKYLFDYTTKNWERPLKSIIPFWAWQKNLARSAAVMPFDRPLAAEAYNRIDRYQQQQYDKEFASLVPELRKLGYTDAEIGKMKDENAKYFQGRLKVGNKWITTPFNAFSEKGLSQLGFNPYLAAAGETATATDSFGQPVKGNEASWWRRIISKFPQADLAYQALQKPGREAWISKPTTEGYGFSKSKQGADKSKANYSRSLDPHAKLGQNALALFGVPRSLTFDKQQFLQSKRLQKAVTDYFSHDWQSMDYPTQQKMQKDLFAKYGLTADEFYKGILAKYDTENTKQIKNLKEQAGKANKSLFDEYSKQPKGTRNLWATNKLRELVKTGYFDTNPFLKSFKWIDPASVAKADRQAAYQRAKSSGDWSAWTAKYGDTRKKTAKSIFWGKYFAESDPAKRRQLLRDNPQFAKKPIKSEAQIAEAAFWWHYAIATPQQRRKLLKDNPQYNTRADWTRAQWTAWRDAKNKSDLAKLSKFNNAGKSIASHKAATEKAAIRLAIRKKGSNKKIKWGLQVA